MTVDTSNGFGYSIPGVDEASIRILVHTFYDRVRADTLIGPIFEARVENWPEHLEKLCDFWSNVVLRTRRYDGRPMQKHLRLPLEEAHFDRWLELFRVAVAEIMPPAAGAIFIDRANRIADSFEMGIGTVRGEIRPPRHMQRR
jgi:hemoglobin